VHQVSTLCGRISKGNGSRHDFAHDEMDDASVACRALGQNGEYLAQCCLRPSSVMSEYFLEFHAHLPSVFEEQGVLSGEVQEKCAFRDISCLTNVVDRDLIKAPSHAQFHRCSVDFLPGALLLALTP
jgi:hypothetical protein